jgi:hypothetical protein
MDMPPEAEYFFADDLLEPVDETERHDHHGHADGCGGDCQADDEARKGFLFVESDAPCQKSGGIQSGYICYLSKVIINRQQAGRD